MKFLLSPSLATSASSESSTAGTYKDRTLDVPDGTLKITGFERGQDYEGKSYVLRILRSY